MALAKDKIDHLKAGLIVLAITLLFGLAGLNAGVHPLTLIVLAGGFGAGAAVEFAQRDSNRRLLAQGLQPIHEVSRADLLASVAAALVAMVALEVAHSYRLLPWA